MASLDHYKKAFGTSDTIGRQSGNHNAWYNRGEALANLGCYEEALASFDKAVEIQPDEYAAWVFRGVVLIHLNLYEEALSSCNKALEIQPDDREAWTFRGAALSHLGRYEEAYRSYDKALGIEEKSVCTKLKQRLMGFFNRRNQH